MGGEIDWESVTVGEVITVDLSHTGLSKLPVLKLYMREKCLDLLAALRKNKKQVFMVSGCPGVGKSVLIYSYAMWQASFTVIYCESFRSYLKENPIL